ncbi:hypothetical protein [Actinocatenispora rupis]|uniref:Glycerophosphoryl diester phosphodiesterase membrane domain-containing protein n=1 Tax=Actinocatenispora rupis TaxID=519421 RepID=A0A8J3J851_9ACTN|nr:hypothetical protein [Actinocatenispora rupis]GID13742.1 hypothetical protein Aru02nite_46310 [Actinocatenispora rupis]
MTDSAPRTGFTVPPPPTGPDPLTGAPGDGFGGWASRTVAVCRRSMLPGVLLLGGATVVPAAAGAVLAVAMFDVVGSAGPNEPPQLPPWLFPGFLALYVVAGYLYAAGFAATLRMMARDAYGLPRDFGATVRFGLRRAVPLCLWYVVAGVLIMLGFFLCVLPAYYVEIVTAMIAPIVVFERSHALRRTFRLMHRDFWPSVAKVLLTTLVAGAFSMVGAMVIEIPVFVSGVLGIRDGATGLHLDPVVTLVTSVVGMLLLAPGTVVVAAGLLTGYAELRAGEAGVTGADLVDAAT